MRPQFRLAVQQTSCSVALHPNPYPVCCSLAFIIDASISWRNSASIVAHNFISSIDDSRRRLGPIYNMQSHCLDYLGMDQPYYSTTQLKTNVQHEPAVDGAYDLDVTLQLGPISYITYARQDVRQNALSTTPTCHVSQSPSSVETSTILSPRKTNIRKRPSGAY